VIRMCMNMHSSFSLRLDEYPKFEARKIGPSLSWDRVAIQPLDGDKGSLHFFRELFAIFES